MRAEQKISIISILERSYKHHREHSLKKKEHRDILDRLSDVDLDYTYSCGELDGACAVLSLHWKYNSEKNRLEIFDWRNKLIYWYDGVMGNYEMEELALNIKLGKDLT